MHISEAALVKISVMFCSPVTVQSPYSSRIVIHSSAITVDMEPLHSPFFFQYYLSFEVEVKK